MATSAFKSTTRRAPAETSSPATDHSVTSSSAKAHRRSRSLSRFSRPVPNELQLDVLPTPRRKFVNTVRGSGFPEISLDDLAMEFFSANDNSSEVEDESLKSEISSSTASFQRRSRSVSRHNNGAGSAIAGGASVTASSQRRGRSVSRRNDGAASNAGGATRAAPNADSRRRRSVSVARYQISDSESDIDHSKSSSGHAMSRSIKHGNSQIASFQRPTASSNRRLSRSMSQTPRLRSHDEYSSDNHSRSSTGHAMSRNINHGTSQIASFQRPIASSNRRLSRSMSQAPRLRSHDGYSSQSSALTDDESRDAHYGKNEIEKTIRAVYAQKKIDHPSGDDVNHGLYEAMRKELRSAVNEIMIELEQTMERKPSALAVHDRLHPNKSHGFQMVSSVRKNHTAKLKQPEKRKQDVLADKTLEEQRGKDGSKIVREVLPDSNRNRNSNANPPQKVLQQHSRKRSSDRNRVSKRLNEEAEKYFEDFMSNIEDTDFSSFDGERSDTSSSLHGIGSSKQKEEGVPVEMEGISLPWLKWDGNDPLPPVTPKPKPLLWDPSQDLELIQEQGSGSGSVIMSSHGSCNPTDPDSAATGSGRERSLDMEKYVEVERREELLFHTWRERNMITNGGLLLCAHHFLH